jgi:hypothetical protein
MSAPVKGFDDALGRAIAAANEADRAAQDFEAMDEDSPSFQRFTAYYRGRARMYAQNAQAWATVAQAMTLRNTEMSGDRL